MQSKVTARIDLTSNAYCYFMKTRKQSIGRKILRVFEIALFFTISVLGYGFMLKVLSSNVKSKSRDRDSIALRSATELNGLPRRLKFLSGTQLFLTDATAILMHDSSTSSSASAAIQSLQRLARLHLSGSRQASAFGDNRLTCPIPGTFSNRTLFY